MPQCTADQALVENHKQPEKEKTHSVLSASLAYEDGGFMSVRS